MSTGALPSAHPMAPVPLRVRSLRRETADTFTLSLDVSGRPGGFPFQPGQFNMLYAFGMGEVPISMLHNHDPCISCATHFLTLKMERT